MWFLRRRHRDTALAAATPEPNEGAAPLEEAPPSPEAPAGLPCPTCGLMIVPPPARNRRCPRCRRPFVVRRVDGRVALLTLDAVAVFDAERRREADEATWSEERRGWLALARDVHARPDRLARLAAVPISARAVQAARTLYLTTAERTVREVRRDGRWGEVGQIRRQQADALYREAGRPVPPPDEVVEVHREGMVAVLRSLAPLSPRAELVSARCCPACRADDGHSFRIADEVRAARLPHPGCPKGLCACDWWAALERPKRKGRRASRAQQPLEPASTIW